MKKAVEQAEFGGNALVFARKAFFFALAAGLALFIARHLNVDLGGLWVVLSAVTILQAEIEDSLKVARNQVLGVTVGVFFGAVCGLMHQTVISVTLAVFLTALVCSISILRGVVNIACAGAAIVILLPVGHVPYITAAHRFVDTVLGAVVAIVISTIATQLYRWWPQPGTKREPG